jgi:hypothetical protein
LLLALAAVLALLVAAVVRVDLFQLPMFTFLLEVHTP